MAVQPASRRFHDEARHRRDSDRGSRDFRDGAIADPTGGDFDIRLLQDGGVVSVRGRTVLVNRVAAPDVRRIVRYWVQRIATP